MVSVVGWKGERLRVRNPVLSAFCIKPVHTSDLMGDKGGRDKGDN